MLSFLLYSKVCRAKTRSFLFNLYVLLLGFVPNLFLSLTIKWWSKTYYLSCHYLLCFLYLGYPILLVSYHTGLLCDIIVTIDHQTALSGLFLTFDYTVELVVGWHTSFLALLIFDSILEYILIIFSLMFIRICVFIIAAQLFLDSCHLL